MITILNDNDYQYHLLSHLYKKKKPFKIGKLK